MQVLDLQRPEQRSPDAPAALCDGRPRTLKEAVDRACAVRHYSRRTFEAYWHWIRLYVHFHGKRLTERHYRTRTTVRRAVR